MSEDRIVNEYGPRLSHLEGQVGGLAVQVQGLSTSMVELGHKLDRLFERSGSQPVNWGWVTTAVVSLGAFIMLYTNPIKEDGLRREEMVMKNTEEIHELRTLEAAQAEQIKALEKELDALR